MSALSHGQACGTLWLLLKWHLPNMLACAPYMDALEVRMQGPLCLAVAAHVVA
jgi:hypothetical protein